MSLEKRLKKYDFLVLATNTQIRGINLIESKYIYNPTIAHCNWILTKNLSQFLMLLYSINIVNNTKTGGRVAAGSTGTRRATVTLTGATSEEVGRMKWWHGRSSSAGEAVARASGSAIEVVARANWRRDRNSGTGELAARSNAVARMRW